MPLRNAFTQIPNEVKVGDEFVYVIKALVTHTGVRFYRCAWEFDHVPQGAKISGKEKVHQLFYPVKHIDEDTL